jgi:hypothetical protein
MICITRRTGPWGELLVRNVAWEETEMRAEFWWGNLKDGHQVGDLVVDGRIILK